VLMCGSSGSGDGDNDGGDDDDALGATPDTSFLCSSPLILVWGRCLLRCISDSGGVFIADGITLRTMEWSTRKREYI
jgi:hypothetical protein